ncbi:hypothetical protein ERJ75_001515300 [Trypanosoma vivax]|nr:hypothetical protein TRVL_05574 [Trypanosoma vivax]KAH8606397.1 hypothetical protein ERJ75_001515300 [Trypanosoma vivax]
MHLQTWRSQTSRQTDYNSLKVEYKDTAAHLLEWPSLRELTEKQELDTLKQGELFFSAQLASFPQPLFNIETTSAPTPDEPGLRPARAVKRHRSPTDLDTTYHPSVAAKRIGVRAAKGMRKHVLETDALSK